MKRMIMGCETDAEDGWRTQVSPLPHIHIRCAGGEYSVDIKWTKCHRGSFSQIGYGLVPIDWATDLPLQVSPGLWTQFHGFGQHSWRRSSGSP
jgi:hypothetical protein